MRPLAFISILLLFVSCSTKRKVEYFWVTSTDNLNFDTIRITGIHTDSLPSGSKTIEYFSKDTINYFVRPDTLYGSQTNRFKNIDYALRLYSDTIFTLGNDTFNVFKYMQNEGTEDGGVIHYFEKNIGIYSIHSTTWPGLTKLQTTDTLLNKKINSLIKATVPRFFLRERTNRYN